MLGLISCMMYANAGVQYMTIEQKNGAKFSFLLKDNPVITYENDNLVVNGNASTSYSIEGVKNYHFTGNDQSAVEDTKADVQMLRFVGFDENTIKVENASVGEVVVLVNINGAIVTFPSQKGLYVLNVDNKSLKLIRK